jgi:hypothetical protein
MSVGQIGHGIFDPFLLIPSLPEMIDVGNSMFPDDEELVNDLSSGIFNVCIAFGQLAGPMYGSIMTEIFNYRLTCDYAAFLLDLFGCIYFLFGQGWNSFKNS